MKVYERYKLKDSFGLISGKDLEFIDDSNLLSAVNNELYNFNIKNHNFKKQAFKKEISCFTQILSEPLGESFDSGNGTAKGCASVCREIAGDVEFQSFEEVGVVCIENEIHYKDSIFNGHRKPITRLLLTAELLFSADSSGLVIVWDLLQQRGIYKLKTTSGAPIFTMIYLRDFLLIADKSTILIWDFKNELIIESLNFTAEINSVLLIENNTAIEGDQIVHLLVSSENQVQLLELNTTKLFQKANFPTLSNTLEASLNPTVTEFESVESGVLLPKTIQVLSKAGTLLSSKYRIRQMKQIQNLLFVQLENQLTLYKLKCPRKTKKQPISLSQYNEIKTEKIRNFTLFQSKKNPTLIKIGISLKSNQIEIFNLDKNDLKLPQTPKSILNTSHQKEIRNLTLTKNNNQVLSISEGEIKLWDLQTLKLLNNFGTEEIPTFAVFMPGDEYFIVSTKSGSLNIYELSSCNLIESIKAHTGPIWSIAIIDKKGLVSGGEDGNVLLFDFDMILDHDYSKVNFD
jgi:WD40 repeat protein